MSLLELLNDKLHKTEACSNVGEDIVMLRKTELRLFLGLRDRSTRTDGQTQDSLVSNKTCLNNGNLSPADSSPAPGACTLTALLLPESSPNSSTHLCSPHNPYRKQHYVSTGSWNFALQTSKRSDRDPGIRGRPCSSRPGASRSPPCQEHQSESSWLKGSPVF